MTRIWCMLLVLLAVLLLSGSDALGTSVPSKDSEVNPYAIDNAALDASFTAKGEYANSILGDTEVPPWYLPTEEMNKAIDKLIEYSMSYIPTPPPEKHRITRRAVSSSSPGSGSVWTKRYMLVFYPESPNQVKEYIYASISKCVVSLSTSIMQEFGVDAPTPVIHKVINTDIGGGIVFSSPASQISKVEAFCSSMPGYLMEDREFTVYPSGGEDSPTQTNYEELGGTFWVQKDDDGLVWPGGPSGRIDENMFLYRVRDNLTPKNGKTFQLNTTSMEEYPYITSSMMYRCNYEVAMGEVEDEGKVTGSSLNLKPLYNGVCRRRNCTNILSDYMFDSLVFHVDSDPWPLIGSSKNYSTVARNQFSGVRPTINAHIIEGTSESVGYSSKPVLGNSSEHAISTIGRYSSPVFGLTGYTKVQPISIYGDSRVTRLSTIINAITIINVLTSKGTYSRGAKMRSETSIVVIPNIWGIKSTDPAHAIVSSYLARLSETTSVILAAGPDRFIAGSPSGCGYLPGGVWGVQGIASSVYDQYRVSDRSKSEKSCHDLIHTAGELVPSVSDARSGTGKFYSGNSYAVADAAALYLNILEIAWRDEAGGGCVVTPQTVRERASKGLICLNPASPSDHPITPCNNRSVGAGGYFRFMTNWATSNRMKTCPVVR